ncbi:MAG: hypothetical protein HOY69_35180 [Streptomyces sp.]|nr:hypothetical protein [Streptomyces sp.]
METSPSDSPEMTAGRQAADDLRQLLVRLGAARELVCRITRWADVEGREECVYVPPLPVGVVVGLLRQAGVVS